MQIRSAKELEVYRLAYTTAKRIYELSKTFPPEERYALTSQIRRSSRSVCLNICEAWAKRRYPAYFLSKLTDCDGENAETQASLDFCVACQFIDAVEYSDLISKTGLIGKMLGSMIRDPSIFMQKPQPDSLLPNANS